MPKEKVLTDVRDKIMGKMTNEGRTLRWLHKETKIPYDTLYSCLKKKIFSLSDANLNKVNKALETDFKQTA